MERIIHFLFMLRKKVATILVEEDIVVEDTNPYDMLNMDEVDDTRTQLQVNQL